MDWTNGYVRVPRALLMPSATDDKACRAWAVVDLYGLAEWAEDGPLPRGTLEVSVKDLAQRWRWSPGRVKRLLRELEDQGVIERERGTGRATSRTTFITYDPPKVDGPPKDRSNARRSPDGRPTTEGGTGLADGPPQPRAVTRRSPVGRPTKDGDGPTQPVVGVGVSPDARPAFLKKTAATVGVRGKASSGSLCTCGLRTVAEGREVCKSCETKREAAAWKPGPDPTAVLDVDVDVEVET